MSKLLEEILSDEMCIRDRVRGDRTGGRKGRHERRRQRTAFT